jgi:hypothetical protein
MDRFNGQCTFESEKVSGMYISCLFNRIYLIFKVIPNKKKMSNWFLIFLTCSVELFYDYDDGMMYMDFFYNSFDSPLLKHAN